MVFLLLPVEKIRGMILEMSARVAGRQAQMMATLHSIADQVAAPGLSSVTC